MMADTSAHTRVGHIVCHIAKPRSFKHFWPLIDTFLEHVTESWPVVVKDYDTSESGKSRPVVCFGVYMSRMDSNIAEAIEPIEGRLKLSKRI